MKKKAISKMEMNFYNQSYFGNNLISDLKELRQEADEMAELQKEKAKNEFGKGRNKADDLLWSSSELEHNDPAPEGSEWDPEEGGMEQGMLAREEGGNGVEQGIMESEEGNAMERGILSRADGIVVEQGDTARIEVGNGVEQGNLALEDVNAMERGKLAPAYANAMEQGKLAREEGGNEQGNLERQEVNAMEQGNLPRADAYGMEQGDLAQAEGGNGVEQSGSEDSDGEVTVTVDYEVMDTVELSRRVRIMEQCFDMLELRLSKYEDSAQLRMSASSSKRKITKDVMLGSMKSAIQDLASKNYGISRNQMRKYVADNLDIDLSRNSYYSKKFCLMIKKGIEDQMFCFDSCHGLYTLP